MPPQQASTPTQAPASPQRWWWLGIAALFLGYAVLSHYSASSPDARGLGATLSLGPLVLIGVILIMGGLIFFPALALGPIVEHLAMTAGTLY